MRTLNLASLYDLDVSKSKCQLVISGNMKAIMASEQLAECDSKALSIILRYAPLSYAQEAIFDACIQWAHDKCQQQNEDGSDAAFVRAKLADCFQFIKFDRMPRKVFTDRLRLHKELFTASEIVDIFCSIEAAEDKEKTASLSFLPPRSRNGMDY